MHTQCHTHTLACIHDDDEPFIVLTETKFSIRYIPVWARYFSRNQILLWDTSEKTQIAGARTRYAYTQIAQGSGGGKQNLRYRQAEKAKRTDDLMVLNRLQGQ
jgi:hypothetical protein